MSTSPGGALAVPTLLAITVLGSGSCAPAHSTMPITPLGTSGTEPSSGDREGEARAGVPDTWEAGLGGSGTLGPCAGEHEGGIDSVQSSAPCEGGDGTAWFFHRFAESFDLGMIGFAGSTHSLGIGVLLRPILSPHPAVRLGAELQAGAIWGSIGIPLAVRAADNLWIYASPSFTLLYAYEGTRYMLPVGLAWRFNEAIEWRIEGGARWFPELSPAGYRIYVGSGLGFSF